MTVGKRSFRLSNMLVAFVASVLVGVGSAQAPCQVAGQFRSGQLTNQIKLNFHCDALGNKPDAIYVQATVEHEAIHAFKARGIIVDDVPIAAATGYYEEWRLRGNLLDKTKVAAFKAGMASPSPAQDVDALVLKYRKRSESEPLESYEDGAKLGGIIFKIFERHEAKARTYILGLGVLLNHDFAIRIVENPDLAHVILGFRLGQYFRIDQTQLQSDIGKLDQISKQDVERYLNETLRAYDLGLVPHKDVVVGGFEK